MEAVLLVDETVNAANGRFAVFGDDNSLVAQGDNFSDVVDKARALGNTCPAIVDLSFTREHIHVF